MSRLSMVALISSSAAVALLIDNMRLRSQLETGMATVELTEDSKGAPESRSFRRSSPRQLPAQSAVTAAQSTADDVADEEEARIQQEVEARLEDAVEERLDGDLDSLVESRVEERLEQRHDRRIERHREEMKSQVAEFIADGGHSEETGVQITGLLEEAMHTLGGVFRAVHDGEIERGTAREEMAEIREDVQSSLTELLGEDEADRLQEGLRGPFGSHRGRR